MTLRKILVATAALSFIALPAMAQTGSDTEKSGHHYQGGPKTEVPTILARRRRSASPPAAPGVTTTAAVRRRPRRTIWATSHPTMIVPRGISKDTYLIFPRRRK
jgi:hypothetical protein